MCSPVVNITLCYQVQSQRSVWNELSGSPDIPSSFISLQRQGFSWNSMSTRKRLQPINALDTFRVAIITKPFIMDLAVYLMFCNFDLGNNVNLQYLLLKGKLLHIFPGWETVTLSHQRLE